jgi:hypothetical protein
MVEPLGDFKVTNNQTKEFFWKKHLQSSKLPDFKGGKKNLHN